METETKEKQNEIERLMQIISLYENSGELTKFIGIRSRSVIIIFISQVSNIKR